MNLTVARCGKCDCSFLDPNLECECNCHTIKVMSEECHRCKDTGWIEAHINHGMYEWTRCPKCQPQVGG